MNQNWDQNAEFWENQPKQFAIILVHVINSHNTEVMIIWPIYYLFANVTTVLSLGAPDRQLGDILY